MKERPILFSAPMVRALLDGTKTQTRRIAKLTANGHVKEPGGHRRWHPADPEAMLACPYGQPSDRLWVRENFAHKPGTSDCCWYAADFADFRAAGQSMGLRWRPSIHMPRWASRLTLEVTGVRVERLPDISEADAMAEGARCWAAEQDTPVRDLDEARLQFRALWTEINGGESWDANPWVWVVEFKVVS